MNEMLPPRYAAIVVPAEFLEACVKAMSPALPPQQHRGISAYLGTGYDIVAAVPPPLPSELPELPPLLEEKPVDYGAATLWGRPLTEAREHRMGRQNRYVRLKNAAHEVGGVLKRRIDHLGTKDPVTRAELAELATLRQEAMRVGEATDALDALVEFANAMADRELADASASAPAPEKLQDADDFRKVFEDGLAEKFPGLAVRPLPDDAYPKLLAPPMRPDLAHQPVEAFSGPFAKMTPMSKAPTPDPPEQRPLSPGQVAARKRALKNVDKLVAGLQELDRLGLREQWIADNIEIVRELRNWLFA